MTVKWAIQSYLTAVILLLEENHGKKKIQSNQYNKKKSDKNFVIPPSPNNNFGDNMCVDPPEMLQWLLNLPCISHHESPPEVTLVSSCEPSMLFSYWWLSLPPTTTSHPILLPPFSSSSLVRSSLAMSMGSVQWAAWPCTACSTWWVWLECRLAVWPVCWATACYPWSFCPAWPCCCRYSESRGWFWLCLTGSDWFWCWLVCFLFTGACWEWWWQPPSSAGAACRPPRSSCRRWPWRGSSYWWPTPAPCSTGSLHSSPSSEPAP